MQDRDKPLEALQQKQLIMSLKLYIKGDFIKI